MRGQETPLYKVSEASRILGVNESTLRRWGDEGKIKTHGCMRLFDLSDINPAFKSQNKNIYSTKQKDDLTRQKKYLRAHIPDKYSKQEFNDISDIGSGLNFKRPGLLQILGLVKHGRVSTIIVASRDRMARFGFELRCSEFGTNLVVLEQDDSTPE